VLSVRLRNLSEAKDGEECLVDAPLLFRTYSPDQVAESRGIDCSNLFDEDPGRLAEQVDLGAERGATCAQRCRRNEHDRPGEQLIGLDDHPVPATLLLMASAARGAKLVDVTPEHACSP